MESIRMLGCGHAMVTHCYNTCFLLKNDDASVLVDCGGGNGLLTQMEKLGENWTAIKAVFISHAHTDHLTGALWLVRAVCGRIRKGEMDGLFIYASEECLRILRVMCEGMLSSLSKPFCFDEYRIRLIEIDDGSSFDAAGFHFSVFDIASIHKKQLGFRAQCPSGKEVVFTGDEKLHKEVYAHAKGADYLMHEAMFAMPRPVSPGRGPVHHGSAFEAGEIAAVLGCRNLIIYHTSDDDMANRKQEYSKAAAASFHGNIYVPDDLETITIQ